MIIFAYNKHVCLRSCYRWQWTAPYGDPAVLQLKGPIFSFPVLYVSLYVCWFVTYFPAHIGKRKDEEDCKEVEEAHHWLLWTIARCKFYFDIVMLLGGLYPCWFISSRNKIITSRQIWGLRVSKLLYQLVIYYKWQYPKYYHEQYNIYNICNI